MSKSDFFSLQCSIFLVGSLAASTTVGKIGFMAIAIFYLIAQFAAARNGN